MSVTTARDGGSAARMRRIVVIGLVAGFLSGLFGLGGGILIVPALVLFAGFGQRLAHGTSLAAVLPIAASALVGYLLDDSVDWAAAGLLVTGAVLGAMAGTRLLHSLNPRVLAGAFALLLAVSAVRLVLDDPDSDGRGDLTVWLVVGLLLLGLASGALAGLLGVGGGVVMVPGMVILFALDAAVARGTSLAVIIPTAMTGTWRNVRAGNADLRSAAVVGLAGVATSYAGSQVSTGLDEHLSNRLFAGLLAVVAVRLLLGLRRRPAPAPATPEPEPAAGRDG